MGKTKNGDGMLITEKGGGEIGDGTPGEGTEEKGLEGGKTNRSGMQHSLTKGLNPQTNTYQNFDT